MAQLRNVITGQSFKSLLNFYQINIHNIGIKMTGFVYTRTITMTPIIRADRWLTESHEWVEVNAKVGTIGISDYAQNALGDIVYAQLPEVGSTIKKGDEIGALESVKAASEIISPVSGRVVEKNEAVENKPGLINTSCYEDGWLFKVEITNPDDIKSLMNEKSYEDFLKTDPH